MRLNIIFSVVVIAYIKLALKAKIYVDYHCDKYSKFFMNTINNIAAKLLSIEYAICLVVMWCDLSEIFIHRVLEVFEVRENLITLFMLNSVGRCITPKLIIDILFHVSSFMSLWKRLGNR